MPLSDQEFLNLLNELGEALKELEDAIDAHSAALKEHHGS